MLGGGTFITQNKVLPGSYINVVSQASATATLSDRGVAAIALPLTAYTAGKVTEITHAEYLQQADTILGYDLPEETTTALNELFKHATSAFIYNSYSGDGAGAMITIVLNGRTETGGDIVIKGGTTTIEELGATEIDESTIDENYTLIIDDVSKDWTLNASETIASGATIRLTGVTAGPVSESVLEAFESITGADVTVLDGVNEVAEPTTAKILAALEPYTFNTIGAYTSDDDARTAYEEQIEIWRDEYGKKCQLVVYNSTKPDYEGIINVTTTVTDTDASPHALVAWVTGAEAGCAVNASCTNMTYDGSYTVDTSLTQAQLEDAMGNGEFVFHLSYGDTVVLEDINSLVTTTETKSDDFKMNQVIRVTDQIANDIAKIFNTKYLGVYQNDRAGRASLWADIVKHHRELETLRAIEDYDSSLLTVEQGDTKKSVVVYDVVNVTVAMSQLYMTIVVQ